MNKEKAVILNTNEIKKFNEYFYELGVCKNVINLLVRCMEEGISESHLDIISLVYVINSYIANLKTEFSEFLDNCNILL